MRLYRFSPIQTEIELRAAIEYVHFASYGLCKASFGRYMSNAGNIGIFCHYDDEYEALIEIRKHLTEASDNWNQKYFRLLDPIVIPGKGDVPETTYTHLYIRKPDPYRAHVGDVDFYLEPQAYLELKGSLKAGKKVSGARIFDRADADMVELYDPDVDVLAYVSTHQMAEMMRVKRSDITKL